MTTKTYTSSDHTTPIKEEHERRFFPRIEDLPEDVQTTDPRSVITQAYLEDEKRTRIREDMQNGSCIYTMTVKSGSGISRPEDETFISAKDFESLLGEATCSLQKIRRYLTWHGINFQLNTYYGLLHGYVQIEVEFDSHEDAVVFIPPSWFGREVTDDNSHGNYSLAKYGKPK